MTIKIRIRSCRDGFILQRLIFGFIWVRLTKRSWQSVGEIKEYIDLLKTTGLKVETKQTYGWLR